MAIKLDMSKVYDRVKWVFLAKMMQKIGFCPMWILWIMECVTSVTYSVNINEEKIGFIKPARGLRQEDLLSPYLFLICAKGLSSLINQTNSQGLLTGMRVAKGAVRLSHLFFADDYLIFCKANDEEARLKGWKEKLLSQAGKEVLLKAVIMALPTYVMSACLLPKAVCKEICSEMARELHEFNLALLAKQLWRILTKPNLLMSKIMRARYFKGISIWRTKSVGAESWCWKSLLQAKCLLEEEVRKQVGNGKSINIWKDRWLPETEYGRVKTRKEEGVKVQRVCELIKDGV
ncbi:uncharacterized protein LOC113774685 [Coffea eugenioides]|uniref:uncharacterized protein LOC113774685 n=1 Tax=Coffea eugenioides TaxID=49369 RepID=UPI000F605665|nr:uncharacterized protein LOC113774685 [Coffea eugenioides]